MLSLGSADFQGCPCQASLFVCLPTPGYIFYLLTYGSRPMKANKKSPPALFQAGDGHHLAFWLAAMPTCLSSSGWCCIKTAKNCPDANDKLGFGGHDAVSKRLTMKLMPTKIKRNRSSLLASVKNSAQMMQHFSQTAQSSSYKTSKKIQHGQDYNVQVSTDFMGERDAASNSLRVKWEWKCNVCIRAFSALHRRAE